MTTDAIPTRRPTLQAPATGVGGPSSAHVEEIRRNHEQLAPQNQALCQEVEFILNEKLATAKIKIHSVESRIKTLDSLISKCVKNNFEQYKDITDAVGARVVCLFLSDIKRVNEVIRDNFEIISIDDKLENNSLGYISVHYLCNIPSRYAGPRYEKIAALPFEIQVRTLCMRCWAAVSHYLDYKGEWDVPAELKRSLNALSGLFYVADEQFERFNLERGVSREKAEKLATTSIPLEINLDTFSAYLQARFPDREFNKEDVSELVQEIKKAGYSSVIEVDKDVTRAEKAVEKFEIDKPIEPSGRFSAVGVVRIGLQLANPQYAKSLGIKGASSIIKKYRSQVPPA